MAKASGGGGASSGGRGGGIQSRLLGYASRRNNTSLTNEQFIGQAASGGVTVSRTPGSRVVARVTRSGRTITLTETTITTRNNVVGGRIVPQQVERTRTVFSGDI